MIKKFLRRTWSRYSKLGKNRKKKQKWRNPKGRDNKMREKRRGYPKVVNIGYKKQMNKNPILIKNISELEKAKGREVIIGKVGKMKKIEIAKKAKEMKIFIQNLNIEKILKEVKKISKDLKKK